MIRRSMPPSRLAALPAGSLLLLVSLAACGGRAGSGEPFAEITAEAGLDFVHFNGMSGDFHTNEVMGAGAALVDYDGDGDLDLYLVQGTMAGPGETFAEALSPPPQDPPLSDRLYRNDLLAGGRRGPTPRLVDVTARSGLVPRAEGSYGMGVAAGDIENDGDFDLYVTCLGSNQLLRNRGDGTFADGTEEAAADDPRWSTSAAFLDFDGDAWLDLFVVNYVIYRPGAGKPCRRPSGEREYCGPQAYEPEVNRLLRNLGGGRFADVTLESGVFAGRGNGLGVVAADVNGDERLDIYVANDLMANHLWINRGDGTFRDEGLERGAALSLQGLAYAGMGVDAGDVDADGDEDLLVTNLGEQGHSLYLNDGAGMFVDSTAAAGLAAPTLGFTGFGAALLDFDRDGDLDLVAVNGEIKAIPELVAAGDPFPLGQRNQLFRNAGYGRFEELSSELPIFASTEVSRGLAVGDLDNDGAPDLVVTNNNGPARLAAARPGPSRWLGVTARAVGAPQGMPGTVADLELRDQTLRRRARADGSYLAANDPRILFGAGERNEARALEVRWPGGGRRLLTPPLDRYLVFEYRGRHAGGS